MQMGLGVFRPYESLAIQTSSHVPTTNAPLSLAYTSMLLPCLPRQMVALDKEALFKQPVAAATESTTILTRILR